MPVARLWFNAGCLGAHQMHVGLAQINEGVFQSVSMIKLVPLSHDVVPSYRHRKIFSHPVGGVAKGVLVEELTIE